MKKRTTNPTLLRLLDTPKRTNVTKRRDPNGLSYEAFDMRANAQKQ